MIAIEIPGFGGLRIGHCVSDFSGTLSEDGRLLTGVRERIDRLAGYLQFHVLTADTHGRAREELAGLRCSVLLLEGGDHTLEKKRYVEELGPLGVVALGNGNNDVAMLRAARIGIAVCVAEGCSAETLGVATLLVRSPLDALDLLLNPNRLIATLRR